MKIETPILLRLGPVPGYRGTVKCLDALETMYARAGAAARRAIAGDAADRAGTRKGDADAGQSIDLHRRG